MTYPEAIVVGFIQGVTELFPVSSLGHNVLIPALIGGSWASDLSVAKPAIESSSTLMNLDGPDGHDTSCSVPCSVYMGSSND